VRRSAELCPVIFVPKISLIERTGPSVRPPLRGHVTAAEGGVGSCRADALLPRPGLSASAFVAPPQPFPL